VTNFSDQANVVRFPACPGQAYTHALERNFAATAPDNQSEFLKALPANFEIQVDASPAIATHIANVDGKLHVYFASFKGLRARENANQEPESTATVTLRNGKRAKFLPFVGEEQVLKGEKRGDRTVFRLPTFTRGAVFWVE